MDVLKWLELTENSHSIQLYEYSHNTAIWESSQLTAIWEQSQSCWILLQVFEYSYSYSHL